MELFLLGVVLVTFVGATSQSLEAPPALLPRDVARMAVDEYNQETEGQAVFKLLKLRNTYKTRFGWGVHFSMNFTIKETHCRKKNNYRIGECRYKANGPIRDCSAQVSMLNFMQDSPLTSMKCHPLQRANSPGSPKPKPNSRPQAVVPPPQVHSEYFPSSYSTAALMSVEEE
ncbi:cathelicidin-2-like [Elgaria multicarinata webbii]|uniref:cathelicidin-2-like n=1 Tax=Elgaria multicarinata webbii TaxID=159646 RepID=UPI002FCD24E6